MKHESLLEEMKGSIGTKDPIDFFMSLTNLFSIMFDKLSKIEKDLNKLKINTALSLQWDSRVANEMLLEQIEILRKDKETYHAELSACKVAYANGVITQQYSTFVEFWINTLGFHPFI